MKIAQVREGKFIVGTYYFNSGVELTDDRIKQLAFRYHWAKKEQDNRELCVSIIDAKEVCQTEINLLNRM